MSARRVVVIFVVALAAATALWEWYLLCTTPEVAITLPAPSGPYAVGRKILDWTDQSRQDPFDGTRHRELMVWVWYPADERTGQQAAYVPGEWGHVAAQWSALTIRLHMSPSAFAALRTPPPIAASSIEHVRANSWQDARLSNREAKFPVLIFSPGLGQMPTDYTALIEDMVSHGYVVFGINPTYFTDSTLFSDGKKVGHMPIWKRSLDVERYYPIWVEDFLFVTDRVIHLDATPGSEFCGRLDLNRLGAFGHSFGGAAAIGASFRDPRIRAGADLDGSPRGQQSTWALPQPFLVLQSEQGLHRDRAQIALAKGLKHGHLLIIRGAHHAAFTDAVCFPLRGPARASWIGSLSGARMIQITSVVLRKFFETGWAGAPDGSSFAMTGMPELVIER